LKGEIEIEEGVYTKKVNGKTVPVKRFGRKIHIRDFIVRVGEIAHRSFPA
jgi:hypothetical protein